MENFMNFAYTILYVDDVPKALTFYEEAFGFTKKFLHESKDYGELESGATTLAFAERKMIVEGGILVSEPNASSPSFEIAFTTDDVASSIQRALKAGATLVKQPEAKPWGQIVAYVTDNSGFLVEICTPVAA